MGASERNVDRRRIWHRIVMNLDARRLVFLDESGANITLARRYGRGPKGERVHGSAPRNYGQNLTLVATLSLTGLDAPMVLDGALDTPAFEQYVEHILVPTLQPGQLVVLDNLSVHNSARVRMLITAAGCRLLHLPSYSPDFNPIELAFAEIKAYLRRVGARVREGLEEAIGVAIDLITPEHARNYFGHCGYRELAQ